MDINSYLFLSDKLLVEACKLSLDIFVYRGLTPRLVMYVSQGALFFTSYEFLKTIMFPEQELPAMNA
jgi:hypothetical protein